MDSCLDHPGTHEGEQDKKGGGGHEKLEPEEQEPKDLRVVVRVSPKLGQFFPRWPA